MKVIRRQIIKNVKIIIKESAQVTTIIYQCMYCCVPMYFINQTIYIYIYIHIYIYIYIYICVCVCVCVCVCYVKNLPYLWGFLYNEILNLYMFNVSFNTLFEYSPGGPRNINTAFLIKLLHQNINILINHTLEIPRTC